MAKPKTNEKATAPYRIIGGHVMHDAKEYFTGDTIECTPEQAALLNVEPADKAAPPPPDDAPGEGDQAGDQGA